MTNAHTMLEIIACFLLAATTVSMIWYVWESYFANRRRASDETTYSQKECRDALSYAYYTVGYLKEGDNGWTLDDLVTLVEITLVHSKNGEIIHVENSTETDAE